jgi:hypothetical protein
LDKKVGKKVAYNRRDRTQAYLSKARHDLTSLAERGVVMGGNAFSSYVFAKGELSPEEASGGALLGGADGRALRASLEHLGYAPEDWAALSTTSAAGGDLDPMLLREAVCALDPSTLVACDEAAAHVLRAAYADELSRLPDFPVAMLEPGYVAPILGMRVMNLGGFSAALADPCKKQLMWARLKQLPPLGEPY